MASPEDPAWEPIRAAIQAATGEEFEIESCTPVGGGCINAGYRLQGSGRAYFVKLNRAGKGGMFEAEYEGLAEIAATRSVRVPEPVCWGEDGRNAWLVTEFIAFSGRDAAERLGLKLAAMHRHTAAAYGWHRDNTIGATPQPNAWMEDWTAFFRERRLRFQLQLAASHGYTGSLQCKGERLLAEMGAFFVGHAPQPSLLHGDLWSGNWATDAGGEPVIFDPAVYYGDREADIAMTELFGGFGPCFYAAYREAWPLDSGYRVRRELYNLYHILNHANLFGGGYAAQAEAMMDRLLAEIGSR